MKQAEADLKQAKADLEHALGYEEPALADEVEQPQAKVKAVEEMDGEDKEMKTMSAIEKKHGKEMAKEFEAWLASRSKKQ